MRWLSLLFIGALVYIESVIFVKMATILGVFLTLMLVLFTSFIGFSLVKKRGFSTVMQMQQKMAMGESPAAEILKSVALVLSGFLLILPGFFTDFLGLLLLLSPVQKAIMTRVMPHLTFASGGGFAQPSSGGNTFEGEFSRHDENDSSILPKAGNTDKAYSDNGKSKTE